MCKIINKSRVDNYFMFDFNFNTINDLVSWINSTHLFVKICIYI